MVRWWKCTECGKAVDEFEKAYDQGEKDGKMLCSTCRKKKEKKE